MSAVPQEAPEIEEVTWLKYIRNCFVAYLAGRYKAGEALEIANWCNKKLDVTGRLLGEVRELARSPLTRPAPQEAWKPIDTVTRFTRCEMRGIYADTDGDGLFAFMATHWRPEVGK